MCCQKAFHAFVTLGGWPTAGEAIRFSSAVLCSLNSLRLSPARRRLAVQLLRNGAAPIALDPGSKQSGSLKRRSCSKGRCRYLTVPNSRSTRLYALLRPVCQVVLRPNPSILPSGSFAAIIFRIHPCPLRSPDRANRTTHRPGPSFPRAVAPIQNP
jgi:hypothetical protein